MRARGNELGYKIRTRRIDNAIVMLLIIDIVDMIHQFIFLLLTIM